MLRKIIWVLLSFLYLSLRFQNLPGVLTDHGVVLNDTDPYYRLHRIERMVNHDLVYPLHDPDLNFPQGFDVPWPTGLDATIALPLKTLGVTEKSDIEAWAAVSIPFLSLPTLWITMYLGQMVGGWPVALLGGLLLTVYQPHLDASAVGQVDHHFLEALFTVLALLLGHLLAIGRRRARKGIFALLVLAPLFWGPAWILSCFLGLGMLFQGKKVRASSYASLFYISSALSLAFLLFSTRFSEGTISPLAFSWSAPLVYGLWGLLFDFISLRSELVASRRSVILRAFYPAAIMVHVFFANLGSLAGQIAGAVSAVSASSGIIGMTSEAVSPLASPFSDWWKAAPLFLLLASAGWLFSLRDRSRFAWLAMTLAPLVLGFFQFRFLIMAGPVLVILIGVGLIGFLERLVSSRVIRVSLLTLFAFLLLASNQPQLGWTAYENAHPLYRPVRGAARFLAQEKPPLPREERAIVAHWEFGHWMLYDANLPVVANPFQPGSSLDTIALFTSEGTEALDPFLATYPARYLLVEAPSGRLVRWLRLLGKDQDHYVKVLNPAETRSTKEDDPAVAQRAKEDDPAETRSTKEDLADNDDISYKPLKPFFDLLAARFFFGGGLSSQGELPSTWRQLFVSPFASPTNPEMPALKVYERVRGARLVTRSSQAKLRLVAKVETRHGSIHFSQIGMSGQPNEVSWTVPYAKVDRGGVRFDGLYRVLTPEGETVKTSPPVEEVQVWQSTEIRF